MPTVAKTRSTPGNEGGQPVEEPCACLGHDDDALRWHKRTFDVFNSGPEFIAWGERLVMLAHEAGSDRELTRLVGCHQWYDQGAVYQLATALEELAEASTRALPVGSR